MTEAGAPAGAVWYLDTTRLNHSAATVQLPESPVPDGEVRPFVCLRAAPGDRSTWAPLTSQPRPWRLEVRAEWLVERRGSFLQGGARSWLNGQTYVGEDEAFRDAVVAGGEGNRFSAVAVERMRAHLQGQPSRDDARPVGGRVRHEAPVQAPGETRDRERAIWDVLAADERAALALLLERLGRAPTGWYGWLLIRRPAELLAWRALVSQAERRGMTRRAAEDAAAGQLGQHPDTLRSRLR